MDEQERAVVEVELSAYTAALKPTERVKAEVPPPIARRADQLYALLLTRARVRKGDLIAALIQDAPTDPDELKKLMERYGTARVWETICEPRRRSGKLTLPERRQGRPSI